MKFKSTKPVDYITIGGKKGKGHVEGTITDRTPNDVLILDGDENPFLISKTDFLSKNEIK